MKPRIFISAVTKELKSVRQLVANTLLALGYEPVWQDIFETSADDIRPMLRKKIDSCSAIVQIVGDAYGAEPPEADQTFGRVSYTHYEAQYAKSRGKKIYYLIAHADLPRDAAYETIDTPCDDSDAAQADAAERRDLQSRYLAAVQASEQIYYRIQSPAETELSVRRLRDELDKFRRGFRTWMLGVSAALMLIVAGIFWLNWGQQVTVRLMGARIEDAAQQTQLGVEQALEKTVQELTNSTVLAERIRQEIRATAEAKIKALPDEKGRWQQIAAIENERDLSLGRVEDLIKLIQEGLKEGAAPVFQRAIEILEKEGTDATLQYLESRRPAALDDARRHAARSQTAQAHAKAEQELRNKALRPLVLEAHLLQIKLQWPAALRLREQVAELAPDWFEARNFLGLLLLNLARFEPAEQHLRAALKLASPDQESAALNNLGLLLQKTNRLAEAELPLRQALAREEQAKGSDHRDVATHLNNLAQLLRDVNKLQEAEALLRRALVIHENSLGPDHPDVASNLNNLGLLLHQTHRYEAAELLLSRAWAIHVQAYGPDHAVVAIDLDNYAQTLIALNQVGDAKTPLRHALTINERVYGSEHPEVAKNLNNLGFLLSRTNCLLEAEPFLRRALAISEGVHETNHPDVAAVLNNLSHLLRATNRFARAEPLLLRAWVIHEGAYGPNHPEVVIDLNNLALLFEATDRPAAAEALMRRALAIKEAASGPEHRDLSGDLYNLARLLDETDRAAEAEPLLRRAVILVEIERLAYRRALRDPPSLETHEDDLFERSYRTLCEKLGRPSELPSWELLKQTERPLPPIVPEIDRRLGPAPAVGDVLKTLHQQALTAGKPAAFSLALQEPLTPYLNEHCPLDPDYLNDAGVKASERGDLDEAIVFFEKALQERGDASYSAQNNAITRMNLATALLEAGRCEQALLDLRELAQEIADHPRITQFVKGRVGYQLALCEWHSGDADTALALAKGSLRAYTEAEAKGLAAAWEETQQLMDKLAAAKPPPPRFYYDESKITETRARYQACADLAALPLKESSLPLVDQILGPAGSVPAIIKPADRQFPYQDGPHQVWFVPLSIPPLTEPFAPLVEEILGPIKAADTAPTPK